MIRIGTAGWTLPTAVQHAFPGGDSHLARYARVLECAEINSSFHRSHRPGTYARWSASVGAAFRFAVKMPKTITHAARLEDVEALLDAFFAETAPLGRHLGCVLVQLPPSLAFDAAVAHRFLASLRTRYPGDVAVEPRHATWFAPEADAMLGTFRSARVAADPARVPAAAVPGGWRELAYWRLHGSPRMYYSSYDDAALDALTSALVAAAATARAVWCIFDNTTLGAALPNAMAVRARLGPVTAE